MTMSKRELALLASEGAVCIGCGCDDLHACMGGLDTGTGEGWDPCSWVVVDRRAGLGICNGHAVTDQMREAYKRLRAVVRISKVVRRRAMLKRERRRGGRPISFAHPDREKVVRHG